MCTSQFFPRHSELCQVLFWRNRSGTASTSVRFCFSSSCQCRWAALTAVSSTFEVVFCDAAESKWLTLTEKSSLFNDGESLCAAMLPSSDRQQRDWRDDVKALAASEWWRERRHLGSFPFFPFCLLTLWKTRMTPCYETMHFSFHFILFFFLNLILNIPSNVCLYAKTTTVQLKAEAINFLLLSFNTKC